MLSQITTNNSNNFYIKFKTFKKSECHKKNKQMTTVIKNVNLSLVSNTTLSGYRSLVLASGVSLLACYAMSFIFQFFITLFRTQNRMPAMRKLMETSAVLYWFGIASLFSIYPPFYVGAFNTIISYITLLVVILMFIFCVVDKKVSERSVWSVFYFFYHLLIMIWIVVGLILAYIWSNLAYNIS